MVILERRAAVTDGTWRLKGIFQGRRFTEEQIIGFFGGMSVPDAKRLKDLESENARLKKLLAEQLFENDLIKDALRKKW